jgi:hypothetical protein
MGVKGVARRVRGVVVFGLRVSISADIRVTYEHIHDEEYTWKGHLSQERFTASRYDNTTRPHLDRTDLVSQAYIDSTIPSGESIRPTMPALPIELFALLRRETAAQARNTKDGRIQISGTALGFLIPLFALFILGPIALVFFVRNRRARRAGVVSSGQRPGRGGLRTRGLLTGRPVKISREKARRELERVTEVVRFDEVGGERGEKVEWKSKLAMREKVEWLEGMGGAVGRGDDESVVEAEW